MRLQGKTSFILSANPPFRTLNAFPISSSSRRALTLLELLIVIAIIGVLFGLALPAVSGMRKRANDAKCISNLRQLGTATMTYVADKGFFPISFATGSGASNNWQIELEPYLDDADAAKRCPSAVLPNKGASHYSMNQNVFYDPNNSVGRIKEPKVGAQIEKPGEVILIMDGLQDSNGNAQGGMTQFRGSDGPGQRDVVVSPFQNQTADGKAGGGYPSYRHGNTKDDAKRAANAVFADGHAAPVLWGTIKNRNLVLKFRDL